MSQALLLKPQSPQTFTALGFVHALMGNLEDAITYFHKSLAINRDCIVTSTILKTCIEDLMDQDQVIKSFLDDICSKDLPSALLTVKSPTKRLTPIEESPMKYNCMRFKFDEEEISPNSDNIDSNIIMDISMDI